MRWGSVWSGRARQMELVKMSFWRLGGSRRGSAGSKNGTPESGAVDGDGGLYSFDPILGQDFELEMKKRIHPVVLYFTHTGNRQLLHFAEQGFKVSAEDLVTPYQENRVFLTARERNATGRTWDDLKKLPYGEAHFDGVYGRYLFNFFAPDDGLQLIAWISRSLKPGGVLATSFAHLKNLPEAEGRRAVLTTERYLKKKISADRLVKLYENREIENMLSEYSRLNVVTMKNGDRRVLAIKGSGSE